MLQISPLFMTLGFQEIRPWLMLLLGNSWDEDHAVNTNLHWGSLSLDSRAWTQACSFSILVLCSFYHAGEWKWQKCWRGTFGSLPTRTVCQSCHSFLWETKLKLALSAPISIATETNSNISESTHKCEVLFNLFSFKNFRNLKYV